MDARDRIKLRVCGSVAMLMGLPALVAVLSSGAAFTLFEGPLAGASVGLERGLLWSPMGAVGVLGLAMVLAASAPNPRLHVGFMGRVARHPGLAVLASTVVLLVVGAVSAASLCGCSSRTKAYVSAMKSDLRNLATAEELYLADHGEYSADTVALGFSASSGVRLTLFASPEGWTARTVHEALPAASCVMYYGSAAEPLDTRAGQTSAPGEVLCEEHWAESLRSSSGPVFGWLLDHYLRLKRNGY